MPKKKLSLHEELLQVTRDLSASPQFRKKAGLQKNNIEEYDFLIEEFLTALTDRVTTILNARTTYISQFRVYHFDMNPYTVARYLFACLQEENGNNPAYFKFKDMLIS